MCQSEVAEASMRQELNKKQLFSCRKVGVESVEAARSDCVILEGSRELGKWILEAANDRHQGGCPG